MISFVVFNLLTGKIETNCEYCGIYSTLATHDFVLHTIDEHHGKYVLEGKEIEQIHTLNQDSTNYDYKVDWKNRRLIKNGA